jgi:hypothetical protein
MDSQCSEILEHLKTRGAITPLEALKKYGCYRLGARIWDLKQSGHAIRTDMVEVGEGKRVARYSLEAAK